MADIKVNFIHPTDGRVLTVTLDDTLRGSEVVAELVAASFVEPNAQGYSLQVQGGAEIGGDQSLTQAGVTEGAKIRVTPATDAGMR